MSMSILRVVLMVVVVGVPACGGGGASDVVPVRDLAPADRCTDPLVCGDGCNSDADCAGLVDTPRCDRTTHACVACLPDHDNCPPGQVCLQVNATWTCATSCESNVHCAKLGNGSLCCAKVCVNPATDVNNCGA